jgi:peptidoglycan hydrolase-like protein with peptidoglycan-binding domain
VQSRLKELGYYKFAVDGAFGKGSRAALRAWSLKEKGLASDGLTLDIQKRLFAGTSL